MYYVDQNTMLDHMDSTEPGNLLYIKNIMLKYQCLTKVVIKFTEEL